MTWLEETLTGALISLPPWVLHTLIGAFILGVVVTTAVVIFLIRLILMTPAGLAKVAESFSSL